MGQTRMYECHGGPWDGEVREVPHGTAIEIDMGPAAPPDLQAPPGAVLKPPPRRIGLYVQCSYRPLGSKERTTVLLWEGEEIRGS